MIDAAWRTVYRIAYPVARAWWRLRGERTMGTTVAVTHGGRLLVLRMSYRPGLTLPGGYVATGEDPAETARRELREETGIVVPQGVLDWRMATETDVGGLRNRTECFHWAVAEPPLPRIDNREIVAAEYRDLAGIPVAEFVPELQPFVTALAEALRDP